MTEETEPGVALEDALSRLQCVLIAHRTFYVPENLTWAQYNLLELLRLQGALPSSQMAVQLAVSRPAISKTLKVLKSFGLISQRAGTGDRREQITELSSGGRDFLARAAKGRHEAARKAAQVLSPGEQAIFTEISAKLSQALAIGSVGGAGND